MAGEQGGPIGLEVTRTGRVLSRAFDDALVEVGGSLPMWLIVTALKRGGYAHQRDIAAAVGLEGATLTHHLHRMEEAGLVARHRAPTNRRTQVVELTAAGEALFERMRATVVAFDKRLRRGFTAGELDALRDALERLRANVGSTMSR
jgi:MarR family transcriptional regulator for hemolysin